MCRFCEISHPCGCRCEAAATRLMKAAKEPPSKFGYAPKYTTPCLRCNHSVTWKVPKAYNRE